MAKRNLLSLSLTQLFVWLMLSGFFENQSLAAAPQRRQSPIVDAIEHYSKSLIGRSYVSSPLGEGSGIDPDPLIRFDAFDCTTYVETVIALSLSHALKLENPVSETLSKIRYLSLSETSFLRARPQIDFFSRAHFTSLDWIPNLSRLGIAQDITEAVFPQHAKKIMTLIDKDQWFRKVHSVVPESPIRPLGVQLPIIDVAILKKYPILLSRIPSGTIINFVGHAYDIKTKTGTAMDVAHQGIFIKKAGRFFLRHAKSHQQGVVEEPFFDALKPPYLKHVLAINLVLVKHP